MERPSLRTIPRLGVGCAVYESEAAWFTVDAGGACVYERFFGPEASHDRDELAQSPRRHTLVRGLPRRHLLRFETALLIAMWEANSFRVSLVNLYDGAPVQDSDESSLSTLVGLSYGF